MRLLVLGVTGMLGSAMFRTLAAGADGHELVGTMRGTPSPDALGPKGRARVVGGVDVENHDSLVRIFSEVRPDAVINCVGLVKQLADANNPLLAVPINTLLPHRLAALCSIAGARLVHVSTDCVFSGAKGGYLESDFPDAYDLYGRSKLLGEVDHANSITLRTSIIGHELSGSRSLIGWFLAQEGHVKGYTRAIFSGLPTLELALVVRDFVLPRPALHGLYHVAAEPIDKFKLLTLVAQVYGKKIEIVPDDEFIIDRSLNGERFQAATGYVAPPWQTLIERMHEQR
jgi:dTDP-4-dehydrorhamnose reductase